jgi:oxaloacetate decarboxylase (Na+ extruding) subunit alpha
MISNLQYQLRQAGVADRLPEVLEETERVRADFGYPIMVTPLSQFVGSQAAINVIVGERYAQVTDKTIEYALGRHGGAEAVEGMDPDVRDRILGRPRAKEIEAYEPPRVTLADLREKYGRDTPDEDLILMSIVGDDAVDVVGSVRDPRPPARAGTPLVELVRRLAEQDRHAFVSLSRPGLSVTVRKGPPS